MGKIIFTKHAEGKLRDRKILRGLVLRTVYAPEKIVVDFEKLCAFRQFGKKYLKVVFKRVDAVIIIITQYFVEKI